MESIGKNATVRTMAAMEHKLPCKYTSENAPTTYINPQNSFFTGSAWAHSSFHWCYTHWFEIKAYFVCCKWGNNYWVFVQLRGRVFQSFDPSLWRNYPNKVYDNSFCRRVTLEQNVQSVRRTARRISCMGFATQGGDWCHGLSEQISKLRW